MKKLLSILITLLVVVLASCVDTHLQNKNTITPEAQTVSVEDIKNEQATESKPLDDDISPKEAFEKLRASLHNAMDSMRKEQELSPTLLEHMLLDYSEDTIIVSCRFQGWQLSADSSSSDAYEDIILSNNMEIKFIAANMFKFVDGKLIDMGIVSAPVLVKIGLGDYDIEEITLPEMYDKAQREKDIQMIFGEHADTVNAEVNEFKFYESLTQMQIVQYKAALAGGFDKFPNEVTAILSSMNESGLLDNSTIDGAVRDYFMQKSFRYSSITIPILYEHMHNSKDNKSTLYVSMFLSELGYSDENGFFMKNGLAFRNKIEIGRNNDSYYVLDDYNKIYEYQSGDYNIPVEEIFGEYLYIYEDFLKNGQNEAFYATTCMNIVDSLISGTFDFEKDSLFLGKNGG